MMRKIPIPGLIQELYPPLFSPLGSITPYGALLRESKGTGR
jgi:hypothetical protein